METFPVEVSILIPVYNEEDNLDALETELFGVLDSLGETFEVIFVDDGSRDRSFEILQRIYRERPETRVLRFVRNFGQQAAYTAAMREARGRAVILMDADLQTPAKHIPEFLAKLREGYDIVYGSRDKNYAPLYRRIGSVFADKLVRRLTGFNIPDSVSGYLALDAALVRRVNHYNERTRYLSGLFAWLSYGRYAVITVSRRPRVAGESKYGFLSLVRIVLNFITVFSTRPLHFATLAGTVIMALALGIGVASVSFFARGAEIPAWSSALAAVLLFVASIQLWSIGILGEYIGRIMGEVRGRPVYLVGEVLDRATEKTE